MKIKSGDCQACMPKTLKVATYALDYVKLVPTTNYETLGTCHWQSAVSNEEIFVIGVMVIGLRRMPRKMCY